jgi:hypothetical protein
LVPDTMLAAGCLKRSGALVNCLAPGANAYPNGHNTGFAAVGKRNERSGDTQKCNNHSLSP